MTNKNLSDYKIAKYNGKLKKAYYSLWDLSRVRFYTKRTLKTKLNKF